MIQLEKLLSGGDLRSIGKANTLIPYITDQRQFDELFSLLYHKDRLIVMRSADTIEKITIPHPEYLAKHKKEIMRLCRTAEHKELKWHVALFIPRLHLTRMELFKAWDLLTVWVKDRTNSRIVRVNALQALFELLQHEPVLKNEFDLTVTDIARENIPSINARIRNLMKLNK